MPQFSSEESFIRSSMLKMMFALLLWSTASVGYSQHDFCSKAEKLTETFEAYHVAPIGVGNELSDRAYTMFIQDLDKSRLYFTAPDIEYLNTFSDKLDDEILQQHCVFLDTVTAIYHARVGQVFALIEALAAVPIDYNSTGFLTFNSGKRSDYVQDIAALGKRWERWFRYLVQMQMFKGNDNAHFSNPDSVKAFEAVARVKIKTALQCRVEVILNAYEALRVELGEQLLNTLALCYDPHSAYFSQESKDEFNDLLSTELKSFGVYFWKNGDGNFEVEEMIAGGAAWRSNQIHESDIVVEVTPRGEAPIDLSCLSSYGLESELSSSNIDHISLKLKNAGGQIIEVELDKDLVADQENVITSFVLNNEKKIGYIVVPSFYTNNEKDQREGCANDVAKEILKLKKEGVEGLIFDLRFNGGGSLMEATDLSGIFIDVGPISIMEGMRNKPYLLKDFNRGTAYAGPMIVLINGASASASEVFAGCMQDYNRALIVGNTTYGKATGQIVVPMDTMLWQSQDPNNEITDYINITVSNLYRINRSTHQGTGVVPDIEIPDAWAQYMTAEKDEAHYIKTDSIQKKAYYTAWPALPKAELLQLSKARIGADSVFQQMTVVMDSMDQTKDNETRFSLQFDAFILEQMEEERAHDVLNALSEYKTKKLNVAWHAFDVEIFKMDDQMSERSEYVRELVEADIQIVESYQIMLDYLMITNQ
jgi:carboxyl-terminal processing protease